MTNSHHVMRFIFWQEYEWWLEKLEIAHNVWAILRTNRQYGVSPIEIP